MANELKGKKIAFLATDMVEQVELTEPWDALIEEFAEGRHKAQAAKAEPLPHNRGRDPRRR